MKKPSNPLTFLFGRKEPLKTSNHTMEGKVVLITGATSGIGLVTAKRFAKGKATLILLVRNETKAKEVQQELVREFGVTVRYYLAPFDDLAKLNQTLMTILNHEPVIDVLINNAGIHSTKKVILPSGNEWTITVNHLASFLVTYRLLPLLKKSKQGRILQVNSEGHRFGQFDLEDPFFHRRSYTGLKAYGASKTAQLHTVWHWSDQLQGTNVTINAMHPGEVQSNIGQNNGPLYRWFKRLLIDRFLKKNDVSGESLYYLASDPSLSTTTGQYFNLTTLTDPAKHALKSEKSKQVFEWSIQCLDFKLK
jgi:NAD(P)-dependent dehydrogenase (short-subunit alcohol dehydrogenase family)